MSDYLDYLQAPQPPYRMRRPFGIAQDKPVVKLAMAEEEPKSQEQKDAEYAQWAKPELYEKPEPELPEKLEPVLEEKEIEKVLEPLTTPEQVDAQVNEVAEKAKGRVRENPTVHSQDLTDAIEEVQQRYGQQVQQLSVTQKLPKSEASISQPKSEFKAEPKTETTPLPSLEAEKESARRVYDVAQKEFQAAKAGNDPKKTERLAKELDQRKRQLDHYEKFSSNTPESELVSPAMTPEQKSSEDAAIAAIRERLKNLPAVKDMQTPPLEKKKTPEDFTAEKRANVQQRLDAARARGDDEIVTFLEGILEKLTPSVPKVELNPSETIRPGDTAKQEAMKAVQEKVQKMIAEDERRKKETPEGRRNIAYEAFVKAAEMAATEPERFAQAKEYFEKTNTEWVTSLKPEQKKEEPQPEVGSETVYIKPPERAPEQPSFVGRAISALWEKSKLKFDLETLWDRGLVALQEKAVDWYRGAYNQRTMAYEEAQRQLGELEKIQPDSPASRRMREQVTRQYHDLKYYTKKYQQWESAVGNRCKEIAGRVDLRLRPYEVRLQDLYEQHQEATHMLKWLEGEREKLLSRLEEVEGEGARLSNLFGLNIDPESRKHLADLKKQITAVDAQIKDRHAYLDQTESSIARADRKADGWRLRKDTIMNFGRRRTS